MYWLTPCYTFNHPRANVLAKNRTRECQNDIFDSPEDKIAGIDQRSALRALQVPGVAHHRAGPAAAGTGIRVVHVIGNNLKQLFHHLAVVGRMFIWLQQLVTQQRQAFRTGPRGHCKQMWLNKGSGAEAHLWNNVCSSACRGSFGLAVIWRLWNSE